MRNSRLTISILTLALVINCSIIAKAQKQPDDNQPIVHFDNPANEDQTDPIIREHRGKRYERDYNEIQEPTDDIEILPKNVCFFKGYREEKILNSEIVLIGKVVNIKAFLSKKRTTVYSEFTIKIDQILKNKGKANLQVEDLITTQRWGGTVQFNSGRIQKYRINNYGYPQLRKKYILFLDFNEQEQDYSINTGFEVDGERLSLIDSNLDYRLLPFAQEITFEQFNNLVDEAKIRN
ncbi:MAG: hypothetical protein AB1489_36605 [Acidobacteriota bacterium]